MKIALLCAMDAELIYYKEHISTPSFKSGMGLVNCAATTQHIIDTEKPDIIIMTGIAGGLRGVKTGDIIIADNLEYAYSSNNIIAQDSPFLESFTPTQELLKLALDLGAQSVGDPHIGDESLGFDNLSDSGAQSVGSVFSDSGAQSVGDPDCTLSEQPKTHFNNNEKGGQNFITGKIASSNYLITPKLFDQTLKETDAIAVDMESAAFAHICTKNNIPFLVLRTISDTCDRDIIFDGKHNQIISEIINNLSEFVIKVINNI